MGETKIRAAAGGPPTEGPQRSWAHYWTQACGRGRGRGWGCRGCWGWGCDCGRPGVMGPPQDPSTRRLCPRLALPPLCLLGKDPYADPCRGPTLWGGCSGACGCKRPASSLSLQFSISASTRLGTDGRERFCGGGAGSGGWAGSCGRGVSNSGQARVKKKSPASSRTRPSRIDCQALQAEALGRQWRWDLESCGQRAS